MDRFITVNIHRYYYTIDLMMHKVINMKFLSVSFPPPITLYTRFIRPHFNQHQLPSLDQRQHIIHTRIYAVKILVTVYPAFLILVGIYKTALARMTTYLAAFQDLLEWMIEYNPKAHLVLTALEVITELKTAITFMFRKLLIILEIFD